MKREVYFQFCWEGLRSQSIDHLLDLDILIFIIRYTDKVDVSNRMYGSMYFSATAGPGKTSVMKKEIGDMISFITGLYVAQNYTKGQLLSDASDEVLNSLAAHLSSEN